MATPEETMVSGTQSCDQGQKRGRTFSEPPENLESKNTEEQVPEELAVRRKAQEFFQTCDVEGKGFIARTDMQRLHKELPLSLEELEHVFDALDADGNGSLTPEEFTTGFSHFFFSQNQPHEAKAEAEASSPEGQVAPLQEEKVYQTRGAEGLGEADQDEETQFQLLMDRLGAPKVLEDESDVKQLWLQLRKEEPHLLPSFEDVLTKIFSQLQEAQEEKMELECALRKWVPIVSQVLPVQRA